MAQTTVTVHMSWPLYAHIALFGCSITAKIIGILRIPLSERQKQAFVSWSCRLLAGTVRVTTRPA